VLERAGDDLDTAPLEFGERRLDVDDPPAEVVPAVDLE
jgi:hypothetical protein